MKQGKIPLLCLMTLVLAANAWAQEFWLKKPWKSWSPDETRMMLEDSPWAKKWVLSEAVIGLQIAGSPPSRSRRELHYTVQLRSAAPLRQAVARQVQFQNNYDRMSDQQKAALDAQADQYISGAGGDTIIVHVVFHSELPDVARAVQVFWKGFPSGTVPPGSYLTTSSGKRVEAIRMIAPPGGAYELELIFPRTISGQPVITHSDKRLMVEFPSGIADRVFVEYKLDKMKWNGELAY